MKNPYNIFYRELLCGFAILVGMMLSHEVASWTRTDIQRISQKKNRLDVVNSSFLGAPRASSPLTNEHGLRLSIADMHSFLSLSMMQILGFIGLRIVLNPMPLVRCLLTKNCSRACSGQLMEWRYYPPSRICLGLRTLLVGCLPSPISPTWSAVFYYL